MTLLRHKQENKGTINRCTASVPPLHFDKGIIVENQLTFGCPLLNSETLGDPLQSYLIRLLQSNYPLYPFNFSEKGVKHSIGGNW